MYTNGSGTGNPLQNDSEVPSATQIWLKAATPDVASSAVLQAVAEALVPSGNVYLSTLGPNTSEAHPGGRCAIDVDGQCDSAVPGLGFAGGQQDDHGPGAQLQGAITIGVVCNQPPPNGTPDFVIKAGAPAGKQSMTYTNIPLGAVCTVTETDSGSNSSVTVAVDRSPQQVTIPLQGGSASVDITDTVMPAQAAKGAIRINKTLSSGALTGGTAEFKIVGPAPATTTALTVTMGGIDDNGGTVCTLAVLPYGDYTVSETCHRSAMTSTPARRP